MQSMRTSSKLALGTVQLGLEYGISNRKGKPSAEEVNAILTYATQSGITTFDTAPAYGNSESLLGKYLPKKSDKKFITKISSLKCFPGTNEKIEFLKKSIQSSLSNLKTKKLYGILFHDPQDLINTDHQAIVDAMLEFKEQEKISRWGASVYSTDQVEKILKNHSIDLIQFPFNLLDTRFLDNGFLKLLHSKGIEMHSRSTFLQGLFLLDVEKLTSFFDPVKPVLRDLNNYAKEKNVSVSTIAMSFALSISEIKNVVCGVNSLEELKELVNISNLPIENWDYARFKFSDYDILNPSLWKK